MAVPVGGIWADVLIQGGDISDKIIDVENPSNAPDIL